jgi:hypothetical protein
MDHRLRRRHHFEDSAFGRMTLYEWDKETLNLGEVLDRKSLDPMPAGIFAIAYKSMCSFPLILLRCCLKAYR